MKSFTALALVATLTGGAAFAESHTATTDTATGDTMGADTMATDTLIRSRDIVGSDIYTTGQDMDETSWDAMDVTSMGDGWTEIGEIEDLVLDQGGQLVGVVAEIGGFLDIGDKTVMIEMTDIRLSPQEDGEYVMVVRQTEEQLEELPSVDESFME